SHGGFLVSVVIGLFGALIGGWLSRTLGIGDVLVLGGVPVVWTIVGSAIFVLVLSALRRRR
ncbi:MAG: GlsB/YeaQ/YmgE family stress response membrane protein, partial [Chloroflexi bacterium]|nr:GlsB/YeaQ/YmgE family stress response membrane protein [Chloroflexota bacterium]